MSDWLNLTSGNYRIGPADGRVDQGAISRARGEYYRDRSEEYVRYTARYDRDGEAVTSIVTRPGWLDLDCPPTATSDRLTVSGAASDDVSLDEQAAGQAAQRFGGADALDHSWRAGGG